MMLKIIFEQFSVGLKKWTPCLESMSHEIRDPTLTSSTGPPDTTMSSSRLHSIHNATPLTGLDLSLTSQTPVNATFLSGTFLVRSSSMTWTGGPRAEAGYSHSGWGSTLQSLTSAAASMILSKCCILNPSTCGTQNWLFI